MVRRALSPHLRIVEAAQHQLEDQGRHRAKGGLDHRVVRHARDQRVRGHVPAGALDGVACAIEAIERSGERLDLVLVGTRASVTHGCRLHHQTRLLQVARSHLAAAVQGLNRPRGLDRACLAHERPPAGRDLDQAVRDEGPQRFAHEWAAHPEPLRELAFRRQLRSGLEIAREKLLLETGRHLVAGPNRLCGLAGHTGRAAVYNRDMSDVKALAGIHVLLTGGAGDIGAAIASELASRGARLTLVDMKGDDDARPWLDRIGSGFVYEVGDIRDGGRVDGDRA